ncbi:uncharacterized protein BJ212DRAFT_1577730 [Suillus subaureus]|uniref:Uncharacterized protein n=1 Tax=Suillus subaureus TaxID=48587 RepID=A0A9P7E9K5_9AGAM|nr:uncharacterized protein BJ212DRAFT_1577730 [Suillus subaureus]KAG1815220.1 hypothetical protein BJ212DRAFT_1577730 [Suillus subaureus]
MLKTTWIHLWMTDLLGGRCTEAWLSRRFKKSIPSLEDIVQVYQEVLKVPRFGSRSSVRLILPNPVPLLLETLEGVQYEHKDHRKLIDEIYTKPFQTVNNLVKYGEMIESTLDLKNHNYAIKPGYDERLQALADKLVEIWDGLAAEHSSCNRQGSRSRQEAAPRELPELWILLQVDEK